MLVPVGQLYALMQQAAAGGWVERNPWLPGLKVPIHPQDSEVPAFKVIL